MAEQLNSLANKKEKNFQNFLQFQKIILESNTSQENTNLKHNNKPLALLDFDELFEFLETYFKELHEIKNFEAIVPFLHSSLEQWAKNRGNLSCDIGLTLFHFLENHKDEESEIIIVVEVINTILNYVKSMDKGKDILISGKVFNQLSEILPTIENENLSSSIISSLKLFCEMYPDQSPHLMQSLWLDLSKRLHEKTSVNSTTTKEISILIQLFEEFYGNIENISEETIITVTIHQLLKSEQKDLRKNGYYLFRKITENLVTKLNNLSKFVLTEANGQQSEELWGLYIKIFENLEEEVETDSIINDLNRLKEIVQSKQLQTSWLEILYIRLLRHGNLKVIFRSMNFFLETFTISDLSADVVDEILKASNKPLLYNYEGYFLKSELFRKFLKGDLSKLFELMGNIAWNSIPLYMWISALYQNEKELSSTVITYEEILKLSKRVYNLKSWVIRGECVKLCELLLKGMVQNMSMKDYIGYVESLYHTTSFLYNDFETFYSKKSNLLKAADPEYRISKRLYEVFLKNLQNKADEINKFVQFLYEIPKEHHGWLKLIPYHYYGKLTEESVKILNILYGLNTNSLKSCTLTEIMKHFKQYLLDDLEPSPEEELEPLIHCHLAAIAFYMQQKSSYDQVEEKELNIIFDPEISLSYNNMVKMPGLWSQLCQCLENTKQKLELWIIDEILKRICRGTSGDKILKYLFRTYDATITKKYSEIILDKYPHIFANVLHNYVNPLKLLRLFRFFSSDFENNASRIIDLFCFINFDEDSSKPSSFLKLIWTNGLKKYCDEEYILFLIHYHKELSKHKPLLNEHRIKLRIALAIHLMSPKIVNASNIFNHIWNILLKEDNRLNICYIYESILALYDKRVEMIVKNLQQAHNLTSRQQLSVISVAYMHCIRHPLDNTQTKQTIITNMLSLTMSPNSETRILAQMALLKLLKTEKFKKILNKEQIMQSIENILGPKVNENLNDLRLHMHEMELSECLPAIILFVTKSPFDSHFYSKSVYFYLNSAKDFKKIAKNKNLSSQVQDQIIKCRQEFLEKPKNSALA